jgi:hypothetical protein
MLEDARCKFKLNFGEVVKNSKKSQNSTKNSKGVTKVPKDLPKFNFISICSEKKLNKPVAHICIFFNYQFLKYPDIKCFKKRFQDKLTIFSYECYFQMKKSLGYLEIDD